MRGTYFIMTMRKKQRLMDINKKPPNDFHHLLPCMLVPNLQSFSPNLRPFGQMIGNIYIFILIILFYFLMAQWVIGNLEHHAKKEEGSIVLHVCTVKKNVDRNTRNFPIEKEKKNQFAIQLNWKISYFTIWKLDPPVLYSCI